MINIDINNVYLNDIKQDDLFCLTYLNTKVLGVPVEIFKTFKTFQELKRFCSDNSSDLQLSVCNLSKEEIYKLENEPYTEYSNID